MSDKIAPFIGRARNSIAQSLGIALLVGLVLLLASMQFKWLTELREEEEARRRVALHVAASNYSEYIGHEINRLLERITAAGSVQAVAGGEPLIQTVIELDNDGRARISPRGTLGWLPATQAELHQWLGGPLIDALRAEQGHADARVWLDPPAVSYCPDRCQVAVLDPDRLDKTLLAPAARRMFSNFGDELHHAVTVEDDGPTTVLSPRDVHPGYVQVTDLQQPLLNAGDRQVLGPPGARWLLKVNHGGSSLEAVVVSSHLHNLLLSGGLLGLLTISIGLVVLNARRQVRLAREHLYFAAGVSHDLRTPLSVIASAADNLADGTVADEPHARAYGLLIQREARRLKGMIENVLEFAQSASATHPRAFAHVDTVALIREALDNCGDLLRDRELRLELVDGLPMVRGDPIALTSALTNLIANAAQYATGGNWIRISATAVRVRPRGRALRISISNPVSGPPDPDPKRLFEPFYRGQQARAAGIRGTGIGLTVARNVAQQHGGGVSIDATQPGVVQLNLFLPIREQSGTTHSVG